MNQKAFALTSATIIGAAYEKTRAPATYALTVFTAYVE